MKFSIVQVNVEVIMKSNPFRVDENEKTTRMELIKNTENCGGGGNMLRFTYYVKPECEKLRGRFCFLLYVIHSLNSSRHRVFFFFLFLLQKIWRNLSLIFLFYYLNMWSVGFVCAVCVLCVAAVLVDRYAQRQIRSCSKRDASSCSQTISSPSIRMRPVARWTFHWMKSVSNSFTFYFNYFLFFKRKKKRESTYYANN